MQPTGFVTSADGTGIAVYDSGSRDARATVLAVHGYPDNARVWDQVAARLDPEFRVLRYDVRGTGCSDRPRGREPYRYVHLLEDVRAVLEQYSPQQPVHLLGHDWGSVQGWYFAAELPDRFLSFTSVSGPNVAYLQTWIRTKLAAGNAAPVLRQLLHSSYIVFFKTPVLPELAWRSGALDRVLGRREPFDAARPAGQAQRIAAHRANLPHTGRPPAEAGARAGADHRSDPGSVRRGRGRNRNSAAVRRNAGDPHGRRRALAAADASGLPGRTSGRLSTASNRTESAPRVRCTGAVGSTPVSTQLRGHIASFRWRRCEARTSMSKALGLYLVAFDQDADGLPDQPRLSTDAQIGFELRLASTIEACAA